MKKGSIVRELNDAMSGPTDYLSLAPAPIIAANATEWRGGCGGSTLLRLVRPSGSATRQRRGHAPRAH